MEENFNLHLGKKLRMRRLSLGLTQTKVAEAINVTFQQIQKYEKGTNGVSSNRLMQLSNYLKVPITYFFEDFRNFNDIKAPSIEGVLITNPPYGERIGEEEDLAKAYPLWASTMKKKLSGWRTYFLTSDLRMPKLMRLSPSKKTPLYNGALDCRLFEIKMVAGSNRI